MTYCSRTKGGFAATFGSGFGAAFAMVSLLACTSPEEAEDPAQLSATELQQALGTPRFDFRPLSREPVPQPIGGSIINQRAAIRLGKAFFWDIQTGTDGQTACATCHSSFGADSRVFNTINPGLDGVFASGGVTGPNQTFTPSLIQNDDIVGSQGIALGLFDTINPDPAIAADNCTPFAHPTFGAARQVEFRTAPMIYGAVFLRQLFWAGEASNEFNGATIWGFNANNGGFEIAHVFNAALASQAVGPPNNFEEMACFGRPILGAGDSWPSKMLARPPLQFQRVSRNDSVLGALANRNGNGLICNGAPCTYRGMIAEAFGPEAAANAENIWTIIWGEAVQAYEATLIPDETPFDSFLRGRITALTPLQILGLATFVGRGNCAVCHAGAMLSDASVSFFERNGAINRDGGDQGFHNIGMRNSNLDRGRGDIGPGGVRFTISGSPFDNFAFKTPTLRMIGQTAPYFHTGSNPTLEDVVEFYDRGGDVANAERSADVRPLGLTRIEKAALVDFMRNALTDCRVVKRRAPFDHPSLPVPNGVDLQAVGAEGLGNCRND
jgi:cytochrome c peroxidase